MRRMLQSVGAVIAIWVITLGSVGVILLDRAPTKTIFLVILAVAAPLLATISHLDIRRLRRESERAKADADAAERSAGVARAEALGAAQKSMAEEINAAIVEIVAARQAVVRAAHPDDVLLRLTAAEDQAYAALQSVPEILEMSVSPRVAPEQPAPASLGS